jgi:hypothetical protein
MKTKVCTKYGSPEIIIIRDILNPASKKSLQMSSIGEMMAILKKHPIFK